MWLNKSSESLLWILLYSEYPGQGENHEIVFLLPELIFNQGGQDMGLKKFVLDKRICRFVLVFYLFVALLPSTGEASLIESRLSTGEQISERAEKIESVRKALEHKIVAQRLADHGLSQEEVMARMHSLDVKQLHQLASLSDELGGGAAGAVVGVLLVVLLVLVILMVYDKRIIIQ